MAETSKAEMRRRGKLLRVFRKRYKITLTELGKIAGLSQPMLSQFERGDHGLSPRAYGRLCAAMGKLLREDEQRRTEERVKASEIAAKLGVGNQLANLAGLAGLGGSDWKPPATVAVAGGYEEAFALCVPRLQALQEIFREEAERKRERQRQLAELEVFKNARNIDDPIISELIESFRREIEEKDKVIEKISRELEKTNER